MKRLMIVIKVNNQQVPNSVVFDEKSTLFFASNEFMDDFVRQLISPEQNITNIEWEVQPFGDTADAPTPEDENKLIDSATLSLFA